MTRKCSLLLFRILYPGTRQFHYARAGHEFPILYDGQETILRMPKGNGRALRVFEDIDLVEQAVTISEGGMLLLYSDGLPDAINRQKVSFGYDGICRTIRQFSLSSVDTICDELIKAVVEHQKDSFQNDDVTIGEQFNYILATCVVLRWLTAQHVFHCVVDRVQRASRHQGAQNRVVQAYCYIGGLA